MTKSFLDISSQRLKKLKLFIEHKNTHPIHLESPINLEREAIYTPLNKEYKKVVQSVINNNLLHKYNEHYFIDLKYDLANYINIKGISAKNIFISSNNYHFYEYITELFLQKGQKIILFNSNDYNYEQEVKYINSGRVIIENNNTFISTLTELNSELNNDDYKIAIICSNKIDINELDHFIDQLPEHVVLILKSSNPIAYNYINNSNKTIIILRDFPKDMTIVEPPISLAVSRSEVIQLLNRLQLPNHLDDINLFISKYLATLTNPNQVANRPIEKSSNDYLSILFSIIRENVEEIPSKSYSNNIFNIANKKQIPMSELIDFSNGTHFIGLSDYIKSSLTSFTDSKDRYNYYSQRILLRNLIANHISKLNTKFLYNNILLGAGVTSLLETTLKAFINDGEGYKKVYKEKVAILSHSSDIYPRIIQKNDAIVEIIQPKNPVDYDINEILLKIKRIKPKMLIIDNPRTQIGVHFDKNQIYQLLENITEETLVVFDESFYHFAEYANNDFYSAIDLIFEFPNLIVLRSFSHLHGMAGLRLGYSVSQENLANCIDSVRHPFDVSPFSLHTGIKILQSSDVFEKVTLKYIQEQKDLIYKQISEMGLYYIQSSTNSITFSTPVDAKELQNELSQYKIVIKPLWDNFIRFTIGEQKNNIYFIESLKAILTSKLHN